MKAILTFFIIIILLITGSLYGQIATYTGSGGTSTAVTGYPNEVVTALMNTGFGSNTACGSGGLSGKTVATTWTTYNTGGPRYYIKITPNTGYQLNVTGFSAGMRVSNTGPSKVRYAYSLDNGATWIDDGVDHALSNPGCGSSVASSWGGGALPTGITSTTDGIIVALFPFAPSASTGTFQTNYINITGTITSGCTPPTIAVSPSAPSFCIGTGGVSITASGAGGTGTYTWTPATGLSATTGATITANPAVTTVYTVTGYSSPTCSNTTTVTATVNPLPVVAAITGSTTVCEAGATTTMANATTGGVWGMTNTTLATINTSGVVTGLLAGTDTVTYSATNACGTTTVIYPITINPLPSAGTITGADSVCVGASTVLSNTTPGGVWSSNNTSIATVAGGTTGGVSAGATTISYAVTTVCGTATTIHTVTVNPLPNAGIITGADSVCSTTSIAFSSSVSGGIWTTANAAIASVNASGAVYGISTGLATTTISYTTSTFSCGSATTTHAITVKPQPNAGTITGSGVVCEQASTPLGSTMPGGVWSSSALLIANVNSTGTVYGVAAGTATITYAVTNSCGTATDTAQIIVNPMPPAITGATYVCAGLSDTLINTLPGGTWSSSNTTIATIDANGMAYGIAPGTVTITYTNSTTGCYNTTPFTVNTSVPPSISITNNAPAITCAGTVVTFDAHPVNGGLSPLFVWSVNGVIIAGSSSYTYTPADGDIVRCWFISSLACAVPDTASALVAMTVHHIASPALSITTGTGDTVCTGALTTISPIPVDGGTSPSYVWFVNLTPAGVGSTLSYIPANGDVVTCTMTSNEYCRSYDHATATRILTVSPYLTPVVSTTINPGSVVCEGYPAVYTATQVNGGTMPSFLWSVNGTNVATGPGFNYTPANGDVVVATLISNFPCVSTPTAVSVMPMTVLPITQPVGIVSATPGYIINEGAYDTFRVSVLSGGGIAPTFQWFKNAYPVAGATDTIYITNDLHTGDSINCVVTNTDQCSGVSIFNYIKITVANNVGVDELNSVDNISLFPNPNNGSFSLKGKIATTDAAVQITVNDMTGRNVYTTDAAISNGVISKQLTLPALPAGVYVLHLQSGTYSQAIRFTKE